MNLAQADTAILPKGMGRGVGAARGRLLTDPDRIGQVVSRSGAENAEKAGMPRAFSVYLAATGRLPVGQAARL